MNDIHPNESAKAPKLSICIATFKRAKFIGETLNSILVQLPPGVEIVIVDGASPDDTAEVVARHAAGSPAVRYFREPVNSGVDADYDKAVAYARGEYCWLMGDDDLLAPGAVARVVASLSNSPDLVVVNAESRTPDQSRVLDERLLAIAEDRDYALDERETFFARSAEMMSYIGSVVIRRSVWLSRKREPYYGSLFIHIGVIFQEPPLQRVRVIAEPLTRVRWANAMWTPRTFEIWNFKWPELVWSFEGYSERARAAVCAREPWRNLKMLGLYRAFGAYSIDEYRRFLARRGSRPFRLIARMIAVLPVPVASTLASIYCVLVARTARKSMYDLAHASNATWMAKRAGRLLGVYEG
ncbi:MAG TPA: glycosyltransferase family 2 protein [Thermoanaerobaculia bacterium]|nr:glycosyltransferase family 2 protein [Thermoanaerobaculia bacterium]